MRSRFLLVVWLVAVGICTTSPARASDDSFKSLARVDSFAFGGIGVAGTTSEGEIAFRKVLAEPTAKRDFRNLLEVGNREAKCYALVALRKLEPKEFPALAAAFKDEKAKVKTIGGCMIMDLPMNSVVAGISKGNYDRYLASKSRR